MKQHILISLNSHKSSYETGKMLNSISKVRWLYEVVAKTPRWQALIIWNLSQSAFISSPWHKKCLWLKKDTPALVSPSLLEQILKAYHVPFHTLWNHPWCTAHLLAEKRSVGRTKKKKKKSTRVTPTTAFHLWVWGLFVALQRFIIPEAILTSECQSKSV